MGARRSSLLYRLDKCARAELITTSSLLQALLTLCIASRRMDLGPCDVCGPFSLRAMSTTECNQRIEHVNGRFGETASPLHPSLERPTFTRYRATGGSQYK